MFMLRGKQSYSIICVFVELCHQFRIWLIDPHRSQMFVCHMSEKSELSDKKTTFKSLMIDVDREYDRVSII